MSSFTLYKMVKILNEKIRGAILRSYAPPSFLREMRTKIVLKKTPKEILSRSQNSLAIFSPITAKKTFSRDAYKFNLLSVYSRAGRNGRENIDKILILRVYTNIKNRNTKPLRVHTLNQEFLEKFTTSFSGTRLNVKKVNFFGAYARFWEFVSAWVLCRMGSS